MCGQLRLHPGSRQKDFTTILTVLAHYDPHGLVADHVLRWARALAEVSDRLVIVSTATLEPEAAAALGGVGELIVRRNSGYDFYSWKRGLDHVGRWWEHDRLVLANDSVVGPFRPLPEILGEAGDGRTVRGVVTSMQRETHLQSYLMAFGPAVLADPLFRAFWAGMTALDNRELVIHRYELGLSRLLQAAGYGLDAYYAPSLRDRARIGVRHRERSLRTSLELPRGADARDLYRRMQALPANPMVWAWDAALDGRLPFSKVEVLRDDPAKQGSRRMLAALTAAHPQEMAGVGDYLKRTAKAYRALRQDLGDPAALAGISVRSAALVPEPTGIDDPAVADAPVTTGAGTPATDAQLAASGASA